MKQAERIFLLILVAALSSMITSLYFIKQYDRPAYAPLVEMSNCILANYYYLDETVTEESLLNSALRGMAAGFQDAYAEYFTKEEYEALCAEDAGEFTGIGITLGESVGIGIPVLDVMENGPAERAGMQAGDIIVAVGEFDAEGLSLDTFLTLFPPVGSEEPSVLTWFDRDGGLHTAELYDETIHVSFVRYEQLPDGKGYIRIRQFTGPVVSELQTAMQALEELGAESLIIDLRNNPGGGLQEVISAVELILKDGDLISTLRNRNGHEDVFTAGGTGCDTPIALLINGQSASASELFTGALKDHDRATVIGTKSYGKGIAQSYYPLKSNDGIIKLTTEAYFTPSGICIQDTGITPDIVVEAREGFYVNNTLNLDEDVQLQAAIRQLDIENGIG